MTKSHQSEAGAKQIHQNFPVVYTREFVVWSQRNLVGWKCLTLTFVRVNLGYGKLTQQCAKVSSPKINNSTRVNGNGRENGSVLVRSHQIPKTFPSTPESQVLRLSDSTALMVCPRWDSNPQFSPRDGGFKDRCVFQFHHRGIREGVGAAGLQPATSRLAAESSLRLRYAPISSQKF